MGCCQDSKVLALNSNAFSQKLKEAIDSGSVKRISMILDVFNKKKKKEENLIDNDIVSISKYSLNALAYCCFLGKDKIFQYLCDKGASIKIMEERMSEQTIRPINLICYKGYLNLLKVYLPYYLENINSKTQSICSNKSFTIDLNDKESEPFYDLAIHSACRSGMVNIISFIYNYFKDKPEVPVDFDITQIDDCYGEDAGLIACRTGCFPLVKFLHEQCGVDFKRLNKNSENAIMVCMCGNKKNQNFSYLECLSYLIEIAQLDISYMHEEALIMAEGEELVSYFEAQLERVGINLKKSEIDKEYVERGGESRVNSVLNFNAVFNEEVNWERNFSTLSSIYESFGQKENANSLMNEFGHFR